VAALASLTCCLLPSSCSSPESSELAAAREALGAGRYGEAIEHYTEVTLQAPDSPEAAQALYEVALIHYLRRRDLDAAGSTFRKILSTYPESAVARDARRLQARMYEEDLGEPDKAIHEYELLLESETDPAEKRDLLIRIANCRYTMDDLEGAAEAYQRVVADSAHDEDSIGAYLRLAHIQRLTGRLDEALANLAVVLKWSKDESARRRAYQSRAEVLVEQGRLADAKSCLAAASEEFAVDEEMAALASRIEHQEEERRRAEDGEAPDYQVRWGRGRP
jgi:outer membrane protein assembly factor BamD (BamD/ComL family)